MKKIAILGSTGSIGTQTLDIVRCNRDKLKVFSLVAYSDKTKLAEQSREFAPEYCALISEQGENCLFEAVAGADIAVVATRGITALPCILYCLDNGIDVALANKEALVCAGELVMSRVGKSKLTPIDSEHCAVSRCLNGRSPKHIKSLLLTASGGPFWDLPKDKLEQVTSQQALNHPNWHMGSKITIDSATMMNKSLEVLEASSLFGVPVEKIKIVVQRQSIVHSMVQFDNGEVIAQLAQPDMRLPIQMALLADEGNFFDKDVDFSDLTLNFQACDFDKFPCAGIGFALAKYPPLCRTVANAANDVCVQRFLQGKFCFTDFCNIIMKAVTYFTNLAQKSELTVDNIKYFDAETKRYVNNLLDGQC